MESNRERQLKISIWMLALTLGLLQAWVGRHSMNPDGVSYLDIGEAYLRGDWKNAINAHWRPLYACILALGLRIFRPNLFWEFPVVHLMNFFIYVCAMTTFHFLLKEVIKWNRTKLSSKSILIFPNWLWLILGYTIFIWTSLKVINVIRESPDLTGATLLFLAAGLTLRIRSGQHNVINFLILGAVLGLGVLARAPLLPMTFVFLGITFFSVRNFKKAASLTTLALLTFLCFSGPFFFALSKSQGRLTTGDSAKLAYVWKINKVPQYVHWQGTPGYGKPEHPTRKIFDMPPIYEFGEPINGTYPPWFDPAYWYEGVEPHFNPKAQLSRIFFSVGVYLDYLFSTQKEYSNFMVYSADALVIAYLILLLLSHRRKFALKDLWEEYALIVPALCGLGMFAVVQVIPRYIGGYLAMLWLGIFSSIHLANTGETKRTSEFVLVICCAVIVVGITVSLALDMYSDVRAEKAQNNFADAEVADGLSKLGVQPGTRVANIGYSLEAYWARLGRLKIVSEINRPDVPHFWESDSMLRAKVYRKFAETGARFIVTSNPPQWAQRDGWKAIGNTNYYIYWLQKTP